MTLPSLLLLFLHSGPARASEATVGEIRVQRLDVFDPRVKGEDFWIFRLANKIHVTTRENVIRREILLKPGDPWDPAQSPLKNLESERNLRANGFFRKVSVTPVPAPGNKLDLEVLTQDSWTTMVQFSLGTEGGQTFFLYGITENNLLGTNKSVSFIHAQVGPKIRNIFRYTDPRFLGTRYQFGTLYATTNRGESKALDLKRPFFSLETPYAVHSGAARLVQENVIYENSLERYHFIGDTRLARAGGGLRLPWSSQWVHRGQLGWYYEENRFSPTEDTVSLPLNRKQSGPTFGYSWVWPRYFKETYIDRMERDEDFNLGNELSLLAGPMLKDADSDRARWIFNAANQHGLSLGPGRFLLGKIGTTGRRTGNRWENTLLFGSLNLFWKTPGPWVPQTWIAHVEAANASGLDLENQVILGGNNGLRGYRNFSFAGTKSVLLNLENRFFLPREFFHLWRLGGVLFLDAGSVLSTPGRFAANRFKTDVGIGLRISPTRSTSGRVMRIDLAYALNPGPGPTRLILSVKGGQAFSLFSSSTRHLRQSPGSRLEESVSGEFHHVQ